MNVELRPAAIEKPLQFLLLTFCHNPRSGLLTNLLDTLKATIKLTQNCLRVRLVLGDAIQKVNKLSSELVRNILARNRELIVAPRYGRTAKSTSFSLSGLRYLTPAWRSYQYQNGQTAPHDLLLRSYGFFFLGGDGSLYWMSFPLPVTAGLLEPLVVAFPVLGASTVGLRG